MKESEYRDPVRISTVAARIQEIGRRLKKELRLMEVCGTHTHSIFHFGIRELLPENVQLISGPGCPVCVTPMEFIDQAILFAHQPGVLVTTFGDLMRVPGKLGSLLQAKAEGALVQVIYSPLDAIELAQQNPEKRVVFLGVGFETTTPLSAMAVQLAEREGIQNFFILSAHKLVPPALHLLAQGDLALDGLLLPGHVSVMIGMEPYRFLADDFGLPGVVTGFEPLEILHGILQILTQLQDGRAEICNVYSRVVRPEGNRRAQELIAEYFRPVTSEWRGLGDVPEAGLVFREEWKRFDLLARTDLAAVQAVRAGMMEVEEKGSDIQKNPCICGQILTGRKCPLDCPSFGTVCQPESPLGACMVSSEGTCAAYYRYQRRGGRSLVR